jgi:acyl dehydratase
MPVKADAIGKQWPGTTYEVGAEKIREFADAIGAPNPVHHDHDAAKAAGFRDLVAPPMFCVVYSAPARGPAILDPEVGIDIPVMVHGGQEFQWGEPVCAGDLITTTATCKEIYEQEGRGFYVFESVSTNQEDEETVRGIWTDIVRGV